MHDPARSIEPARALPALLGALLVLGALGAEALEAVSLSMVATSALEAVQGPAAERVRAPASWPRVAARPVRPAFAAALPAPRPPVHRALAIHRRGLMDEDSTPLIS